MVNDEILGAYIDDELDAEARAGVERAIAENAGIALRIRHLRQADIALREALAASGADLGPVAQLPVNEPVAPRPWMAAARTFAPLAAACLIGILVGRLAAPTASVGDGVAALAVDAPLARALDATLSGERATVLGGEARMALSFTTEDGAVCRQFRLRSGHGDSDAVACRDGDDWRMRAQVAVVVDESALRFQTAGAGEADAIDDAIDAMGAVRVLDEAEEADMMRTDWRTP